MGLLIVVCDGVKAFVTPDCAKCLLEDEKINNMDECPRWQCESKIECDPDCEFYTEEWN